MSKYHMQNYEHQIKDEKIINDILKNGKYASISMCHDNEAYIVTLSYGYDSLKNSLYFHSAKDGLKCKFIQLNSSVCGTIIEDNGYKTHQCSHSYRSVVFWGNMTIVQDIKEKIHGFEMMIDQLEKNPNNVRKQFLNDEEIYHDTSVLRLDIKYITGKQNE